LSWQKIKYVDVVAYIRNIANVPQ